MTWKSGIVNELASRIASKKTPIYNFRQATPKILSFDVETASLSDHSTVDPSSSFLNRINREEN
jgi:hypothetical protein